MKDAMAHALMVVGTTSHAGKSFLTTALCRLLARKGCSVAPFKGQNMALNAYVTANGGEIGHAQAVQAWAAGIQPTTDMNPILLKPQGDMTSQVILNGRVAGKTKASDYYRDYFNLGWEAITAALQRLSSQYDIIVCEGAGSPAEINLKHRDLTNMRVAQYLNADTILIADIDRGGVFAHIVGTLELLEPSERALIKGIVINKFRGQRSLLDSGVSWLENRTGIPVLGVIPWRESLLPAEDSLDLLERPSRKPNADLRIVVIRLPRIASFTDFEPLAAEPSVSLRYVSLEADIPEADAVIIPGSKTTIADLCELHRSGMANKLQSYVDKGGVIFGICGGWQMMGQQILDPDQIEGELSHCSGLNFLSHQTILTPKKITRQRQVIARYPVVATAIKGYEIHQGITQFTKKQEGQLLFDDANLGYVSENKQLWGGYLHGLFDNGIWRRSWLNLLRQHRNLPLLSTEIGDYSQQREILLDRICDWAVESLDLELMDCDFIAEFSTLS